jgi:hypothetical protein
VEKRLVHEQQITHLNHLSNRRRLVSLAFALATSGLAWTARSATAIRGWCRSDPVIMIDGELTDLVYDAPLDAPLKVTGPTRIVVTVPRGVQAHLVLAGPGFGQGELVSFEYSDSSEANTNDTPHANDVNDEKHGGHKAQKGKKAKRGKKTKKSKNKSSGMNKQEVLAKGSIAHTESQAMRASVDVEIAVFVPAVENFPVGVDFAPRLLRLLNPIRVEGTSNTWITLSAKV